MTHITHKPGTQGVLGYFFYGDRQACLSGNRKKITQNPAVAGLGFVIAGAGLFWITSKASNLLIMSKASNPVNAKATPPKNHQKKKPRLSQTGFRTINLESTFEINLWGQKRLSPPFGGPSKS